MKLTISQEGMNPIRIDIPTSNPSQSYEAYRQQAIEELKLKEMREQQRQKAIEDSYNFYRSQAIKSIESEWAQESVSFDQYAAARSQEGFGNAMKSFGGKIGGLASNVGSAVANSKFGQTVANGAHNVANAANDFAHNVTFKQMGDKVASVVNQGASATQQAGANARQAIGQAYNKYGAPVVQQIKTSANNIYHDSGAADKVAQGKQWVQQNVNPKLQQAQQSMQNAYDKYGANIVDAFKQSGQQIAQDYDLKNKVQNAQQNLQNFGNQVASKASDFYNNGTLASTGAAINQGVNQAQQFVNQNVVKPVVNNVVDATRTAIGNHLTQPRPTQPATSSAGLVGGGAASMANGQAYAQQAQAQAALSSPTPPPKQLPEPQDMQRMRQIANRCREAKEYYDYTSRRSSAGMPSNIPVTT